MGKNMKRLNTYYRLKVTELVQQNSGMRGKALYSSLALKRKNLCMSFKSFSQ